MTRSRKVAATALRRLLPHAGAASAIAACVLGLALLPAAVRWQSGLYANERGAKDPASVEYAETPWETLIPKGWDPVKSMREKVQGEFPDSGAAARDLARQMRKTWDNAPTNSSLDGAKVRLAGYVVPLQASRDTVQEFLLVPYFGACIHVPPPPASQIVHVSLAAPAQNIRTMDFVTVSGALRTNRRSSAMGMSGYTMDAVRVEKRGPKIW